MIQWYGWWRVVLHDVVMIALFHNTRNHTPVIHGIDFVNIDRTFTDDMPLWQLLFSTRILQIVFWSFELGLLCNGILYCHLGEGHGRAEPPNTPFLDSLRRLLMHCSPSLSSAYYSQVKTSKFWSSITFPNELPWCIKNNIRPIMNLTKLFFSYTQTI